MNGRKPRHRFRIELEAGPTCDLELATRQLRSLLKGALRIHGFKCTMAEPVESPQGAPLSQEANKEQSE